MPDEFEEVWDTLRPESIEKRLARTVGATNPGALTFCRCDGKLVFRINPDGSVEMGEGVTPSEAARQFLDNLAMRFPGTLERMRRFEEMERALVLYGHALQGDSAHGETLALAMVRSLARTMASAQ